MPSFDKETTDLDLDPARRRHHGACFDLGAATARILAESPYRVAAAGILRLVPTLSLRVKNFYLYPDTPADRQMYEHLRNGNYDAWRKLFGN